MEKVSSESNAPPKLRENMGALTDRGKQTVDALMDAFKDFEVATRDPAVRPRSRTVEQEAALRGRIEKIVANAIYFGLKDDKRVRIPMDENTCPLGKAGPSVVKKAGQAEIIDLDLARPYEVGKQTEFGIGSRIENLITANGVDYFDFGYVAPEEVLIIKKEKLIIEETTEHAGKLITRKRRVSPSGKIKVPDTEETRRMSAHMREINAYLADQKLEVAPGPDGEEVDPSNRYLRRVFNVDIYTGGRLCGGFWQYGMKKKGRTDRIRINGEPVVELDYSAHGLRIMYNWGDWPLPDGDPYLMFDAEGRRLPRDNIKRHVLATLGAGRWLRAPIDEDHIPHPWTLADFNNAVRRYHPAVNACLIEAKRAQRNLGGDIQYLESSFLVRLLLALKRRGIVALPIHDAVIVQLSRGRETMDIMHSEFWDRFERQADVKADRPLPMNPDHVQRPCYPHVAEAA